MCRAGRRKALVSEIFLVNRRSLCHTCNPEWRANDRTVDSGPA